MLFNNVEDYADFTISLNSGERIDYIIARTIKPDGTVLEIPAEEFYISTGQSKDGIFYSDDQEIKFTFPGLVENCVIEYKYKIIKDYPFRTDVWNIQRYVPIIKNITIKNGISKLFFSTYLATVDPNPALAVELVFALVEVPMLLWSPPNPSSLHSKYSSKTKVSLRMGALTLSRKPSKRRFISGD